MNKNLVSIERHIKGKKYKKAKGKSTALAGSCMALTFTPGRDSFALARLNWAFDAEQYDKGEFELIEEPDLEDDEEEEEEVSSICTATGTSSSLPRQKVNVWSLLCALHRLMQTWMPLWMKAFCRPQSRWMTRKSM